MIDPKAEYESRLSEWSRQAEAHERAHLRMGYYRLLFVAGILVFAAFLIQTRAALGFIFTVVVLGFFLTGMLHDRIAS